MSSLKKYASNPENILQSAIFQFRSGQCLTIIVEGYNDKRFLSQWINVDDKIRFDGFGGKEIIEKIFPKYLEAKKKIKDDFAIFVVDIDFDSIISQSLYTNEILIYNVFCEEEKRVHYNDLEIFLVNTSSFEKLLENFDISKNNVAKYRQLLEKASRDIGKYRLADNILVREKNLSSSILNGIDLEVFFDPLNIEIDTEKLKASIPGWSNYKHYVSDLINKADLVNNENNLPWSLSRGHDVTEMISLHLKEKGFKTETRERIELNLRIGAESLEFKNSPMGKKLLKLNSKFPLFK